MPEARFRKGWRRLAKWQRAVLAVLAAAGLIVLVLLLAIFRSPGWYKPPVIAAEQKQQVRNNLVDAEQAFTEHLRAGVGPFVYHIHQNDLNRWIAMRREIYPLIDEFVPPELSDPFVVFDTGRITVAGRYVVTGPDLVLSIDLTAGLADGALTLRAIGVRSGSMTLPMGVASGVGLDTPIENARDELWPGSPRTWGDFVAGFHLEPEAWWQNGGVAYRVLDVSVEPGRLNLTIEPLGHQSARARRRHASSSSPERLRTNRPANR
ncbi:MAG: hypothetical protein ABII12_10335 [Planctomycetota bacterium]